MINADWQNEQIKKIIKLQISMQQNQTNFLYQEHNSNFPEYQASGDSKIGKILAKYRQKQPEQPIANNQYSNANVQNTGGSKRIEGVNMHAVNTIGGINYSELYQQLKIQKANEDSAQSYINSKQPSRQNSSYLHDNKPQTIKPENQVKIQKAPFSFQSAIEIRNRKVLPGVIMRSPKTNNVNGSIINDISFSSSKPELINQPQQADKQRRNFRLNRQFRISEIRDKGQRRPNYHQVSDLSINENMSQHQLQRTTQPQIINNRKIPASQRERQRSKSNQKQLSNSKQKKKNKQIQKMRQKPKAKQQDKKISQQHVLGNSRSIGVGNHRIDKKDLQHMDHIDSEMNTPVSQSKKQSPRYREQFHEQQIQVRKQRKVIKEVETKKLKKQVKDASVDFNPQNQFQFAQRKQKVSNQKEKEKEKSRQHDETVPVKLGNRKNGYGYQMVESVHIQTQKKESEQPIQQNVNKSKIHYSKEHNLQNSAKAAHNLQISPKVVQKLEKSTITNRSLRAQKQKSGTPNISIEVSRVASSIAPKQDPNQNYPQTQLLHFENQPNAHIQQQTQTNLLQQLQPSRSHHQHQPAQQLPQQKLQKSDYITIFNLQQYNKIYQILKSIQVSLKCSIINVQQIIRSVKLYLQVIATGGLDNIDQFDLPLHKKKIIKNSLFFQRLAVVVIAYSYCQHTVKDNLKYLLNMVSYSINNCLILAKVLQQTQISQSSHPNPQSSSLVQKSDRLLMKRNLDTLRNNNNVLLDVIQKLSKPDQLFHENIMQIIKLISKSSLQNTFYSLLEYFAFYLCNNGFDNMVPFLAVVPNPYLAPVVNCSKYTLVVDVVEIFCFGTKKSKTNIFRPYTQHFLNQMSQYFEIIAFTNMFPAQIDKVIDLLDPKGLISHRLYKHHTINNNNQSLKYLDRIGRNVDEMILLDNENTGGSAAYQNCIHIPVWKGSKNDTVLAELCPLLAMIALKKVPATEAVRKVREQSTKNKKEGVKYINFGISLD